MKNYTCICVFASGGGGNFKYLVENKIRGKFEIIALVVDRECDAVEIARENDIPIIEIENKNGFLNFEQLLNLKEIILSSS